MTRIVEGRQKKAQKDNYRHEINKEQQKKYVKQRTSRNNQGKIEKSM